MILIDIPMPERCLSCPCRREGAGKRGDGMACQAMEAAGKKYVLVDEYAETRPADCPIRLEVMKGENHDRSNE